MKEIIFRQWTADDLTFNLQTKLTFAQCDKNSKLAWSELLRLTSDIAVEDFNMRGLPWQFLVEKGIIFVVSRSSYHIKKMPGAEDEITLSTWEEKATGPFFTRRYQIKNTANGEILITGFSLFTLIDFKSRKIVPEKDFDLRPRPEKSTDFDGIMPGRIKEIDGMKKIGSHTVSYSDMDSNGHANNSKYMNFVLDALPEKFQQAVFKDLRINYSKEALYGTTIELFSDLENVDAAQNAADKKIRVIGKCQGQICFECELYLE